MREATERAGLSWPRPKPSTECECLIPRTVQDLGERYCLICKQKQPLDNFHKQDDGQGGRRPYCKPCYAQYERDRRAMKKQLG